jgi:hypothetical protein
MPFPEIFPLAALPWREPSWQLVLPLLFFLSLLAATGAHLTAVLAQAAALAGRRAFRQKYALQASRLAFWAGIPFCCLAPFLSPPWNPDPSLLPEMARRLPPVLWILPALIHRFTWNPLQRRPGLHLCLGLAAVPFNLALLALPAWGALREFPPPQAGVTAAAFLLPVFAHCLSLAFAAAASFCLPWLFLQRAAADYGRDYYAFALRAAARQALAATLASLAAGAILLALHPPRRLFPEPIAAAAAGLCLICLILWTLVLKSPSPLRHKPGAFAACLFFPFAAQAQFSALWCALTAP